MAAELQNALYEGNQPNGTRASRADRDCARLSRTLRAAGKPDYCWPGRRPGRMFMHCRSWRERPLLRTGSNATSAARDLGRVHVAGNCDSASSGRRLTGSLLRRATRVFIRPRKEAFDLQECRFSPGLSSGHSDSRSVIGGALRMVTLRGEFDLHGEPRSARAFSISPRAAESGTPPKLSPATLLYGARRSSPHRPQPGSQSPPCLPGGGRPRCIGR